VLLSLPKKKFIKHLCSEVLKVSRIYDVVQEAGRAAS